MGKGMIMLGLLLVIVGVIMAYAPGLLSWFGKLPGDIRIESEKSQIFIPLTSMIIVSVIASLVLSLLGRH